jgi:predicted PurR-regulated permease PerM
VASKVSELSDVLFLRRVIIAFGVAALALALYKLSDVVLLIFGAVLVALLMRAIARPLQAETSMSERVSLLASVIGIVGFICLVGYLFGTQIGDQLSSLAVHLPEAAQRISKAVPLTKLFADSSLGALITNALSWGTTIFGAAGALVLVLVGGTYFALKPELYKRGFLILFPEARRPLIESTMNEAGAALRVWLGSQFLAMIVVGVMTATGLVLVGVPSALALGVIAGALEFIPIVGPVLAAIPALLLASSQDWETVAWTLAVFVVVQQTENNLLMPLLVGRAAGVAPAVGLFAVVAIGVLFGPLGLLLGYPLAIVANVAVRKLYVRETLGEKVEIAAQAGGND